MRGSIEMVQEEYVMLFRAVLPIAFLSLLLLTTVAGGQESGASNTTSEFQPGTPDQDTAATNKPQPVERADASTPSEVQTQNENLKASTDTEAALGADEVVQPSLRRAFKASGTAIPCSVVGYQLTDSKPVINLLCPAVQISAPMRVYLKMAWKDLGDISHLLGHKLVKFGASANLRSKEGQSKVELTYQDEGAQRAQKRWFDVNLVSVGLAKEGDYR